MARDDIKAIIERGVKIPKAKNGFPDMKFGVAQKPNKFKPAAEQPKLRTAINAHRVLRGTRK